MTHNILVTFHLYYWLLHFTWFLPISVKSILLLPNENEENGNAAVELWTHVKFVKLDRSVRACKGYQTPWGSIVKYTVARFTISFWRTVVNLREYVNFYFLNQSTRKRFLQLAPPFLGKKKHSVPRQGPRSMCAISSTLWLKVQVNEYGLRKEKKELKQKCRWIAEIFSTFSHDTVTTLFKFLF